MALISEDVTQKSAKTSENRGVIQVAVIVHTGAQTPEILVSLAALTVPWHGSEDSDDKSKRSFPVGWTLTRGLDRWRLYGKVKVETAKYSVQDTGFTSCQAFEALGILLELRNCHEDSK